MGVYNLTLYLINDSTEVTATVYNEVGDLLPQAVIKVLKYDTATNSYILRETQVTNFEGQSKLNLQLNSEFYKFLIEYPQGTPRLTTVPTYVYSNSLSFTINIADQIAESFYEVSGVKAEVSYNPSTKNFKFDFNDASGIGSEFCLKIYKKSQLSTTQINSSCLTTSTGSILLGISNVSATYIAKGFMTYEGDETLLDSETIIIASENPDTDMGLFIVAILTMIFGFLAVWELSIAFLLAPLPLLIGSLFGFIAIPMGISISVYVVFVILAMVVSRR
jgi:hypothetical protein